MATVDMPYIDAALAGIEDGEEVPQLVRHFHWGLFPDPEIDDDRAERYYDAALALTEALLDLSGVADGRRVLDVGCGFGGTLERLRARHPGCTATGLNIDHRQLRAARRVVGGSNGVGPVTWINADACHLPVPGEAIDHVFAVECAFHFPSRRKFFREAARVLRPGGTLTMSDFLVAPDALKGFASTVDDVRLADAPWFGHSARPLSPSGYEKLARSTGFEPVVNIDVTRRTMPTYPAMRRIYGETGDQGGIDALTALEGLAAAGHSRYHLLAFRKR